MKADTRGRMENYHVNISCIAYHLDVSRNLVVTGVSPPKICTTCSWSIVEVATVTMVLITTQATQPGTPDEARLDMA